MRRFGVLAFMLLLLGVVGCDHTTKHVAETELGSGRAALELVPGVLELTVARNTDTAFSLLGSHLAPDGRFLLLLTLASLATLAIAVLIQRRWRTAAALERAGGALVIGGALGNLSDRVLRGHVIDFIHVEHWPVFNVADVAICVGVGLLMIAWRRRREVARA